MKRLARFFVSIKSEMKNVKWPTRKEMVKYSISTLLFIITFAVFFGLIDLAISGLKVLLG